MPTGWRDIGATPAMPRAVWSVRTVLKQITAKDFQGHHRTVIDLDPQVTCLIGPSDAGKTALIRLAYWVAFNQPTGDDMVREGTQRAVGKLAFDDCTVVRSKGKGRNTYALDGKIQKAFGAGKVPDHVAAAMRLDPINFQMQHDAHFWFGDTAGKVSQELNRVVDLGVIDSSLAEANADLKKAKAAREVCEERMEAARKQADALAWVPAMSQDLDSIKVRAERLEMAKAACVGIDELLRGLEDAQNRAKEASDRAGAALTLSGRLEKLGAAIAERESLSSLLDRIAEMDRLASRPVPDLSGLDERVERIASLRAEGNSLEELLDRLDELEAETCRLIETSTRARRALDEAAKGTCPVCGQPMARS